MILNPARFVVRRRLGLPASARITQPGSLRIVIALTVLVSVVLAIMTAIDWSGMAAVWENGYWTSAALGSALVAVLSVRGSSGTERTVRLAFSIGLVGYALGQVAWDLQTVLSWWPVPGPSDALYLSIGLSVLVGFPLSARGRLVRTDAITVWLDAATVFFAIVTVLLVVLDRSIQAASSAAAMVLTVAYPTVFLASAGAGLLAAVATRAEPRPRGAYLLLAGFLVSGVAWVIWLDLARTAVPAPGSAVGYLFAVAHVLVGLGVATWTVGVGSSERHERIAWAVQLSLPVIAVAVTLILLASAGRGQNWLASAGGAIVIGLAVARQTLVLAHRDRAVRREQRARERATRAEGRYGNLIDNMPAVVYLDEHHDGAHGGSREVYLGDRVESLTGYPAAWFLADSTRFSQIVHSEDRPRLAELERRHRATGHPLQAEYRVIHANGNTVWVRDEGVLVQDPDGRRLTQGFLIDVTERKQLEDELIHQAVHDPLTGLANRVLFADRVEHALTSRHRGRAQLAVLFIDLDNFKSVNDSLGHAVGDELLRAVAKRLVKAARPSDTVARLGGDEYAMLLEGIQGPAAALATAERIVKALEASFDVGDLTIGVRASIGVTISTEATESGQELLRDADAAMYRAKSRGKGLIALFEPEMHASAVAKLRLEADLRMAIERNELTLVYQPIVEIGTRRLRGFEALVRWRHPSRGLVSPAEFIPMAEESGLIVPIGRWVLREACRQHSEWQMLGGRGTLKMSVNISARELAHPDLVSSVTEALAAVDLDPSLLVLEVTESDAMRNIEVTASRLEELRSLGVRIALDDFGTGYSSFAYLQRLPVDVLKIDRSFVATIGTSARDAAVAETLVRLGQLLNVTIVAEGVETAAQAERLAVLRCNLGQGYYYARPMEPAAAAELISGQPDRSRRAERRPAASDGQERLQSARTPTPERAT